MGQALKKHNELAEKLYSEKDNEDFLEYEDLYAYLNMLYRNSRDTDFISVFDGLLKRRWGVKCINSNLLYKLLNQYDTYISVNNFYTPNRCTSSKTVKINAVLIDLDYYNIPRLQNLSAVEMIKTLRNEIDYLEPSFYVDSGRGLYLIWLLNETYSTVNSRKFYKNIEEMLINKFKDYGADEKVKDLARVIRMPGTINSKTKKKVSIILPRSIENDIIAYSDNAVRFELSDIKEYFNDDKPSVKSVKNNKRKQSKESKVISINNFLTLNYSRAVDLETLVEIRKDLTGSREELLFLYRLNLLYANLDRHEALKKTLELNNKLNHPLSENEVKTATRSAETNADIFNRLKAKYDEKNGCFNTYLSQNGCYLYKNSTIIKLFNISAEEQKYMKTLIDSNEKNRRKRLKYAEQIKSEGKTSKQDELLILRKKIKALLDQGFSAKDIIKQLNLPRRTVYNHIKYIKENRL